MCPNFRYSPADDLVSASGMTNLPIRFGSPCLLSSGLPSWQCIHYGAGVTLAIALSCTGVALFVGACIAGSTAFTVAIGELWCPKDFAE